jgi:hypothetical protein
MWIESYGVPLHVELLNPSELLNASAKPVISMVIGHMQPALLYNFVSQDKPGTWILNVSALSSGSGYYYTPVELAGPSTILPQMSAVKVDSSGLFSLGFRANLGLSYDTSVCLVGKYSLETVRLPIPSGLGTGQLLLSRNGTQTMIQPSGKILSPFSFWFELHAGRSYQATSALITRDIEEASSSPIPISPGSTGSYGVDLTSTTAVREGRATVRAFFESSSGLQTFESPVLIPDNSAWEWLSGCTSSENGVGSNFTASASLNLAPDLWPRTMYFMYSESGVEGYSKVGISVLPSVVNLVAAQWGAPLTDKGLAVTTTPGVTSAIGNSTVFLASTAYPIETTLLIPGPLATLPLLVEQPYSDYTISLLAGKISVESLFNGAVTSNSSISLRLGDQTIATGKGSPTFYVPIGTYTLFGSYHGANKSVGVQVVNATQSSIVLEFGTTPSSSDNLLAWTAAVGSVVSGILWLSLLRDWRKKSKPG